MNQTRIVSHRNVLHFHRLPSPVAQTACHISRPNHPEPKKVGTKKISCLPFLASLLTCLKAVAYSKNARGWRLGSVPDRGPPTSLLLGPLDMVAYNCNSNTCEEAE